MDALNKIALTILGAGALVAAAIYQQPEPARYQGFSVGSDILRLDTQTGTVIGCEGKICVVVMAPSQPVFPTSNDKTLIGKVLGVNSPIN